MAVQSQQQAVPAWVCDAGAGEGWYVGLLSLVEVGRLQLPLETARQQLCAHSHRGLADAALGAEVRPLPRAPAVPRGHQHCKGGLCPGPPG